MSASCMRPSSEFLLLRWRHAFCIDLNQVRDLGSAAAPPMTPACPPAVPAAVEGISATSGPRRNSNELAQRPIFVKRQIAEVPLRRGLPRLHVRGRRHGGLFSIPLNNVNPVVGGESAKRLEARTTTPPFRQRQTLPRPPSARTGVSSLSPRTRTCSQSMPASICSVIRASGRSRSIRLSSSHRPAP